MWTKTLNGPSVPERLQGKTLKAEVKGTEVHFTLDYPDNPTNNEIAYLQWIVGQVAEQTGVDLDNMSEVELVKE